LIGFWTVDESWIVQPNFSIESWLPLEDELPERMTQIIGPTKSKYTIRSIRCAFSVLQVLPQNEYFLAQ
jgi:hypothetical protein